MRVEHKVVTIITNPSVKKKCSVLLLDLYVSRLPQEAEDKNLFYCRPLQKIMKSSTEPWYSATLIGRNMLQTMVRQICEEAGIHGQKTNHSLRVCGHSSLDALQRYERVTEDQ